VRTKVDNPYGWKLPALSKDQAEWLDSWFDRNALSAAHSAPLYCHQECPYRRACPLDQLQVPLPIGRECPIERTLLSQEANRLRTELGVQDDDPWSLSLVEYASLWKILFRRALLEAGEDRVIIESYRGVDKEGNSLWEKKLNPALSFAEKVKSILHDIGEDLIATKKAKAKLATGSAPPGPDEYARQVEAKIQEQIKEIEAKTRVLGEKARKTLPPPEPIAEPPDVDDS